MNGLSVRRVVVVATALLALTIPAAAPAQQATEDAYNRDSSRLGVIGEIETEEPQRDVADDAPTPAPVPTAPAPAVESAGRLPFTGADVALLAFGGALLLGLGLGLRRFSRSAA